MGAAKGSFLRTGDGRLRLFWRLVSFMGISLLVTTLVAIVLPPSLLSTSVAMLVGAVVGGWLVLLEDGRAPGALGFYADAGALSETARGTALGVAVGVATVLLIALLGGLRWAPEDGSIMQWLRGGLGALLFFTVPAAAEEAVLRGYPLQALAESWGAAWALVVTSIAFGAFHLGNPNVTLLGVTNVAVAGLFLGVVYLKTASLWWATGAHLGWNWSHGFLTDVSVSGLDLIDAPFYEGISRGPSWLSGGSFGPEGSVVSTLVVLAASLLCWRADWLRPSSAALAAEPLALIEAES